MSRLLYILLKQDLFLDNNKTLSNPLDGDVQNIGSGSQVTQVNSTAGVIDAEQNFSPRFNNRNVLYFLG